MSNRLIQEIKLGNEVFDVSDKTLDTRINALQTSVDNEINAFDSGRVHGNIGVTTSMQMYESFWLLMQEYGNIYDSIATLFLQDFVIPIL